MELVGAVDHEPVRHIELFDNSAGDAQQTVALSERDGLRDCTELTWRNILSSIALQLYIPISVPPRTIHPLKQNKTERLILRPPP